MVATREELRRKRREQEQFTPLHPTRVRMSRAPRQGPAVASTPVNEYVVVAYEDASIFATHVNRRAATLTFVVPGADDVEAHHAAVRFLRRRGPDYLPATPLRITLDSRGRARAVERA